MPRYYFHLYDDLDVPDDEGAELADVGDAETYGVVNARALAADEVRCGWLHLNHRIEIADEQGRIVRKIRFADVVEIVD
jgi:hypothetical protein